MGAHRPRYGEFVGPDPRVHGPIYRCSTNPVTGINVSSQPSYAFIGPKCEVCFISDSSTWLKNWKFTSNLINLFLEVQLKKFKIQEISKLDKKLNMIKHVGSSLQIFRKFTSNMMEVLFVFGSWLWTRQKYRKFTSKLSKVHFVHDGSSLYLWNFVSNKKKTRKFTSITTEVKNHTKKFTSNKTKI
jgi:hypothetical protein